MQNLNIKSYKFKKAEIKQKILTLINKNSEEKGRSQLKKIINH